MDFTVISQLIVCPTYVGMNRAAAQKLKLKICMPHVCGDEPKFVGLLKSEIKYAPRMWG